MNLFPDALLLSRDEPLRRRLEAALPAGADLRTVPDAAAVDALMARAPDTLLVLDLRQEDAAALLPHCATRWPQTLVIALGLPRTDPYLAAEDAGVYAAEDREADLRVLRGLMRRALAYARLRREHRQLQDQAAGGTRAPAEPVRRAPASRTGLLSLQLFSRAFRCATDVQGLLHQVVEAIAGMTLVMRAGIFARLRDGDSFRLRSGLRCLDGTQHLDFAAGDPLVQWMSANAHLISRSTLTYVHPPQDRALLQQALDALGAEVIIPLQGRQRLSGWLFVGHRATGVPFEHEDLEDLMAVADHVAVILDNALLTEEHAIQKTLAETLLQSLPTGIITVDAGGIVRWCNRIAGNILDIAPERVLNQPVAMLGSRLADLLWRALQGESLADPVDLDDPALHRRLSAHVRRISDGDHSRGAVALVHDLSRERALMQQQAAVERLAFWQELAAAMSHEIRNPLVAISTFAQLLPERYADPEFRNEFRTVVAREIERLNGITEHINALAHPPEPVFQELDLGPLLVQAVDQARGRDPAFAAIPVAVDVAPDLPPLVADARAVRDGIAHLVANAIEAIPRDRQPAIRVSAGCPGTPGQPATVVIDVRDNGRGIPAELRAKIGSPFCTSKARGLGLGLAITQRIVRDHGGQFRVDTGPQGTCVTLVLPLRGPPKNPPAMPAAAAT